MTKATRVGEGPAGSWPRWARFFAPPASVGLVALVVAVSAFAPTTAAVIVPSDGATLSAPPSEVSLTIVNDDPIAEHHVAVSDANGNSVTGGLPQTLGARITVPVSISESGTYLIAYHIRFVDGAQISGICRFNLVRPGEALVAATPDATTLDRAGHHHGATDPLTLALVFVNFILVIVAVLLLLRLPGFHERR